MSLEFGQLNESGLSRFIDKTSNNDFCILTAFRFGNSLKVNRQLNRQIFSALQSKRMGGYMIIGHWRENSDDNSTSTEVTEESVAFIRNNMEQTEFIKFCTDLCKKYNQDAVLIGLNGEGVFLYYKNGKIEKIGNKISLGKVGTAYSQMRNKKEVPFIFEGTLSPHGMLSSLVFSNEGILYFI